MHTDTIVGARWGSAAGESIRRGGAPEACAAPADLKVIQNGRFIEVHDLALAGRAAGHPFTRGPGLWKSVQGPSGTHPVFEIPAWVICRPGEESGADESGPLPLEGWLAWAEATRSGLPPENWVAPAAGVAEAWLGNGALTLQVRGELRRVEHVLAPGSWLLRIELCAIPASLPAGRVQALRALADQASAECAMARVGFEPTQGGQAMVAEVDLTGSPHSELILKAAVDALKHSAAWLLETAVAVANPGIAIACLGQGEQ